MQESLPVGERGAGGDYEEKLTDIKKYHKINEKSEAYMFPGLMTVRVGLMLCCEPPHRNGEVTELLNPEAFQVQRALVVVRRERFSLLVNRGGEWVCRRCYDSPMAARVAFARRFTGGKEPDGRRASWSEWFRPGKDRLRRMLAD